MKQPFRHLAIHAAMALAVFMTTDALASTKAAAKKKNAYGAIAWHKESNSLGYSYDFPSSRQAGTEALRQCGNARCEVILSLQNECGALYAGSKGYAARRGHTEDEARTKAMNACGPQCRPLAWACTR